MGRRDNRVLKQLDVSPCKEGGGHTFLVDAMPAVAPLRSWNGHQIGRRLRRKGGGILTPERTSRHTANSGSVTASSLEDSLRRLSFTNKELEEVIEDTEQFRSLQSQLRQKGAITNTMVKEGIHLYVQDCLEYKRQSDSPRNMITPTNSSIGSSSSSSGSRQTPSFHTPQSC